MSSFILPCSAEVIDNITETPSIFTLKLRLVDAEARSSYQFQPGQFNMLYLPGVGEVAISIVSDPEDPYLIDHTIRRVGRVTEGLAKLEMGQQIGLRGPFGMGWPLGLMGKKDIVIVTGGLGCAPVVAMIRYLFRRRSEFGRVTIIQGVKHADDLIWRSQYEAWQREPDTEVLIAADQKEAGWPFHVGRVTELFEQIKADRANSVVLMCGPEGMMQASAEALILLGFPESCLYLSMERNMQCAIGHCGHCQFGAAFICKDGPVFCYPQIKPLLGKRGF